MKIYLSVALYESIYLVIKIQVFGIVVEQCAIVIEKFQIAEI